MKTKKDPEGAKSCSGFHSSELGGGGGRTRTPSVPAALLAPPGFALLGSGGDWESRPSEAGIQLSAAGSGWVRTGPRTGRSRQLVQSL